MVPSPHCLMIGFVCIKMNACYETTVVNHCITKQPAGSAMCAHAPVFGPVTPKNTQNAL